MALSMLPSWKNNTEIPANSGNAVITGFANYFDIYNTGINLNSTVTVNRVAPQSSKVFMTDLNNDGKTDIVVQTQPFHADHPPTEDSNVSFRVNLL